MYWHSITSQTKNIAYDNRSNTNTGSATHNVNNNHRQIEVIIKNTSDVFYLNDLKLVWYFNSMLSNRWNQNSKTKNSIKEYTTYDIN